MRFLDYARNDKALEMTNALEMTGVHSGSDDAVEGLGQVWHGGEKHIGTGA